MDIPTEPDLSLRHLEAEVARIDVLIRREVRRWQLAGQDPGDAFRGLYVSDAEADMLLGRPFGASWGQMAALEPEEAQAYADANLRAARQVSLVAEAARSQGQILRLEHLCSVFGLDRFDRDALLIGLAVNLDLRYERLYGYLQDDVTRKRPTVNLVLNLLCESGQNRLLMLSHFAAEAPLFKYRLLERVSDGGSGKPGLLNQLLLPDESIVAWLLGRYRPRAEFRANAALVWPHENRQDRLLAAGKWAQLEGAVAERPIMAFYGPDGASQLAAARLLAAHVRRPILRVDLAAVMDGELSALDALRLTLRDARLTRAIPYISGWDTCLTDGAPPPELLEELCAYHDLAIVGGQTLWRPAGIERDRNVLWLEFPIPAYGQRRALWMHFLGEDVSAEDQGLTALAGQFTLTASQIRDAVASARDTAAGRGGPVESGDLFAAARAHSSPRLATLARKIVPRYDWEDIVLPEDQVALLHEIVNTVRGRPLVLEQWGVGRKLASGSGVTMLFSGPPGTGKTMGAEVISRELGLDMYKIDLSTVVSKYIGETEKNLEQIFKEAETSNAILFFDEADSLFGKRSEVRDSHDRYANIEIAYLLQRMEAYDGVTILATNLRANLDEAFTRRLQFAVDFPFPEEDYRLRIWQALFPPDVPRSPEIDFGLLAHRFRLAGGSIRNIIVSAAYLAAADGGKVRMRHLLHGTRRELRKMGKLVDEEDMRI